MEVLVLHEACLPKSVLCLFCSEKDPKKRARSYRSTDGEVLGSPDPAPCEQDLCAQGFQMASTSMRTVSMVLATS